MKICNGLNLEDEQRVGRLLKNAFGVEEVVTLKLKHWKHFDWLADNGKDMDEWVAKLDIERHRHEGFHITLRGYIEMGLVQSERKAYLSGKDVPLFINPEGYLPPEEKPLHKQEMKAKVTDATGDTVMLKLPRGHWQYLEWLGKKGTDVHQYIIDADNLRQQPKWKNKTLRGVLEILLREDEKRRYQTDDPSPLFISPDGYDL